MSDDWTRAEVNRHHDQGRAATTPDVITREAEARAREHVARAREADARSRLWNGLAVFLWGFLAANALIALALVGLALLVTYNVLTGISAVSQGG